MKRMTLSGLFGETAAAEKTCPCCGGVGEHECYPATHQGNAAWFQKNERGPQGVSWGTESALQPRQAAEDLDDPGLIHRGLSIVLPHHIHDFVHDENQPPAARAHMLLAHVRKAKPEITSEEAQGTTGGLGNYWSPRKAKAAEYGDQGGWKAYHDHEREHGCGDPDDGYGGCPTTQVVLHAGTPPEKHHWNEVFRDGERYDPEHSWRLPVRPDAKLMVHGISWKQGHDSEHSSGRDYAKEKAEPYSRYDFLRPMRKRAAVTFGPGADEHIGEDEYEPDDGYVKGNWDRWHPMLPQTIHRAMGVKLPADHPAHDTSLPIHERAQAVVDHVAKAPYGGGLGMHWTSHPEYLDQHLQTRLSPGDTPVMLHAKTPPREHIEDNGWVHEDRAIRDWDTEEHEVPVKRNVPVHIQGVTWHGPDGWQQHYFDQPVTKRAGASQEDYARREGEDGYEHEDRIRHGLSMGHLTYQQAREHKYMGGGREENTDSWTGKPNGQGWQPLPQELYHTTTDAAGVMAHGLKSAQELGHKSGHGLGGTPQWLSLTDREDHAHNMLDALHEYHDHLNGKTSFADLHKAAQNGEGAKEPFHEAFMSTFGREPDAAREARMQGKRIEPGFEAHEDAAAKGWEPHPQFHQNFGEGKDGRTYGNGWIRPSSIEERHEEYGAFSRAREWSGKGKPSILFVSNDRKAFAAKDPSNFAVLKVRPKPGAQGFPMEGEHEWRTGTGHAVDIDGEPIRRQASRTAALQGPHEVDLDAMDSASRTPHREPRPGTMGTDSDGHQVQMTTMDGWAHNDGSLGHEDNTTIGDKPVYTHDHTWLPNGRYWGPNSAQNDQRLFEGDHLRPELRADLLSMLDSYMAPRYKDWRKWAKAYFAGSQAAQWLDQNGKGNGDFDMLIGIDYDAFRDANPEFEELEDPEIDHMMTEGMRKTIDNDDYHPPV